ncbi:MAG: PKD domain-containing protein [Mucilaginibacter sp.]|nr:PKD domain-containing protein [Mucilaginibacter sp.]
MGKIFTKGLFVLFFFLLTGWAATAQTITIGAIDPGPYGQGSTIAVPIKVSGGCINQTTNVYNLYLSDANGNFGSPTLMGSTSGFYAPFVNGIIPTNAVAGTNYKVMVTSSQASTSGTSTAFTINAVPGIKAGASSTPINPSVNSEVFGSCSGNPQNFNFTNTSEGGNPATARFFNELDQIDEGTFPLTKNFPAKSANYTVTIKTTRNGVVGTKDYQLINNVTNNSFTITGNGTVCLGSGNTLDYNVDITTNNGLLKNYPGLIYHITWGHGSSTDYTFCDIVAANGKVSHTYLTSSCGSNPNGRQNVFEIDIQPTSPYCNSLTQPVTTYARILSPPQNKFSYPPTACTNNEVTFTNISAPGDNPNSASLNCSNINAKYSWFVDGLLQKSGYGLSQPFIYRFTTKGQHSVVLHFENNNGLCDAVDFERTICIQDPPTVAFDLVSNACLSGGSISPVNNTITDEACSPGVTYNWVKVSGPASGVAYNASLKTPAFTFSQTGVYQFRLDVTTASCGTTQGPTKTIVVNSTPIADLSPNTTICTVNAPVSFDPNAGETKTTLGGTSQPDATTYTWTLSNGATFAIGSNNHSQYPQIIFPTTGTYTITVRHQNNCGDVSDTQQITVANGPTVTATAPSPICEGNVATLTGSPGVGGIVTALRWTSPTGGATNFADPNAPVTTYTPTTADIAAGQVVLTYTVTTSLGGACSTVAKNVTVLITRKASITSVTSRTLCTGTDLNYAILSPTATNYTWTAAVTGGTATGFSTTGNTANINDVITNTGTTNATVTYTITPYNNTCPGNVFTLTVTVFPNAVGGTTTGAATVCKGDNTGQITLTGSSGAIVWQQSTNGGATWVNVMPAQTGTVLTYNNLTQSILYRAAVTSGNCSSVFSTSTTITVNQQTTPANAGPDPNPLCNLPSYTLQGNDPGNFTGQWTQIAGSATATIVSPTIYNSQVTGLSAGNSYTFRWTIKGLPPCADTFDDVTVVVKPDVVASFNPSLTEVCGLTPVQFTNTSTPNVAGTQFLWNFGDGTPTSTEINPSHTYTPNADGSTATYTVSLTVMANCAPHPAATRQITVSGAQPNPGIKANYTGACGSLTLSVQNLTAGNNISYTYHLVDDSGVDVTPPIVKTNNDKSNAVFPTVPVQETTTWHVYMEAVNSCGANGRSPSTDIPVSPSGPQSNMQFKNNVTSVCVGTPVIFRNLSSGGETYTYTFYDENKALLSTIIANNTNDIDYPFADAGKYYVSVTAANAGCGAGPESDLLPITVYPLPQPSFTYTADVNNKVTFNNTTPAAGAIPAQAITYTWKFGDGSVNETAFNPLAHQYSYEQSPYTVTLTATTPSGCTKDYTQKIEIKFTGELFLPNAFQPASSSNELRTFKAKGQKLKEWNLQIFNNWGQLVWQTNKLDADGSPVDGWDGTYKGVPVPQGVYVWQATARFINGADWKGNSLNGSLPKRTGVIHLIR